LVRDEPLRSVWVGIRRVHGVAPQGKAPVVTADLKAMVAQLPDSHRLNGPLPGFSWPIRRHLRVT